MCGSCGTGARVSLGAAYWGDVLARNLRVVRDGPRALLDVRAVRAGVEEVDEVGLRAVHYKVEAKAFQQDLLSQQDAGLALLDFL